MRLFLFDTAFIAEFNVQNNHKNSIFEDLRIDLKHSGETFEVLHITPAKPIATTQTGQCYVGIRKT